MVYGSIYNYGVTFLDFVKANLDDYGQSMPVSIRLMNGDLIDNMILFENY